MMASLKGLGLGLKQHHMRFLGTNLTIRGKGTVMVTG